MKHKKEFEENCNICAYLCSGGYDSECNYQEPYECERKPGFANLKSFPFKKKMPCFQLNFWYSEFPELIKTGSDKEFKFAMKKYKEKYVENKER